MILIMAMTTIVMRIILVIFVMLEDFTCRQCFNRTSTTHYQISMAQTLAMAIMMIMLFMLSMRMKDYDGELFKYC